MHVEKITLFRKPAMADDPANGTIPAVRLPEADAELARRYEAWCKAEARLDALADEGVDADDTAEDEAASAAQWRFYHEPARTLAGAALKLSTLSPSFVDHGSTYADVVDACNDPACGFIDQMAPVSALDDLLRLAEAEAADRAADAELVAAVDEYLSLADRMNEHGDPDHPDYKAMFTRSVDTVERVIRTAAGTVDGIAAKARLAHALAGEALSLDGTGWHRDWSRDVPLSMMRDAVRLGGRASA